MKKLCIALMFLGFLSTDLFAQNTKTKKSKDNSMQDSGRRQQDTIRNRNLNDRNRTNRMDTTTTTPFDTSRSNWNNVK